MQKSKRASQTITFQPTDEAAELLKIALGDNPKRGEMTNLLNKAIVQILPDMMEDIVRERNRMENALRTARRVVSSKKTVDQIEREVVESEIEKIRPRGRSSSK